MELAGPRLDVHALSGKQKQTECRPFSTPLNPPPSATDSVPLRLFAFLRGSGRWRWPVRASRCWRRRRGRTARRWRQRCVPSVGHWQAAGGGWRRAFCAAGRWPSSGNRKKGKTIPHWPPPYITS
eukprot:1190843-Prorocentrum_minimum.AAC.3